MFAIYNYNLDILQQIASCMTSL